MMADPELSWAMKVYNGLGKDIERLMHNFVETGSIRYEGFARIWQEMNFSLVYCGLKSLESVREFMEEAFRLSVLYLSPPFDFQQRTGGLYVVYAFYFSQRHRPRIKVRLSRQQWKDLMEMEADLKKQGHLDAYYVLLKLKMHKAFCFAYSSKQYIFETQASEENQDRWLAENQREIEQAFPESLLRKLHETHHKYQLLKNQLGVSEEENLKHVQRSMAEVIANRFSSDVDEDVAEKPSRELHVNRVAAIKEKSFLHGVAPDDRISSSTSGNTASSSSESDHVGSPARKRRGRRTQPPPPAPDTRPMAERLMPVLREYQLSDSEDEQDKSTTVEMDATAKNPELEAQSQTISEKKPPNSSPKKRKRKTAKTPSKEPAKKPKRGESTSVSSVCSPTKKAKKAVTPKEKTQKKGKTKPKQGSSKKSTGTKKSKSVSPLKASSKNAALKSVPSKAKKAKGVTEKPGPKSPMSAPETRKSKSVSPSRAPPKNASLKGASSKVKKAKGGTKKAGLKSPKSAPETTITSPRTTSSVKRRPTLVESGGKGRKEKSTPRQRQSSRNQDQVSTRKMAKFTPLKG